MRIHSLTTPLLAAAISCAGCLASAQAQTAPGVPSSGGASGSGLTSSQAQTAPRVGVFNSIQQNPVPELQQVAALRVPVSLEAKRLPLSGLLAEMQKQSGVAFKSGEDFPAAKTFATLRVREMPLASLMGTLSRLYGVRWMEDNGAWTMRASDQGPLYTRLLRSRGRDGRYSEERLQLAKQQRAELAQEMYDSVDKDAWRSPDGVPFTSLPQDVQERVRTNPIPRLANWLTSVEDKIIERELERLRLSQQKLVLRLGQVDRMTPTLFSDEWTWVGSNSYHDFDHPQLAVYTADGRFVVNVFPTFRPQPEAPAPQPEPQGQAPAAAPAAAAPAAR